MISINKTNGESLSLTVKIFIGLVSGLAFGILLSYSGPSYLRDEILINGILKLAGGLFVRSIKMLVVPLVFISLVCGARIGRNCRRSGRRHDNAFDGPAVGRPSAGRHRAYNRSRPDTGHVQNYR